MRTNAETMFAQAQTLFARLLRPSLASLSAVRFLAAASFTIAKLVEAFEKKNLDSTILPEEFSGSRDGGAREADAGSISRKLGKAFGKRADRRYGETQVRIERAGEERNAVKWKVVSNGGSIDAEVPLAA
jgi:hypothetical protein